MTPVMQRDWVAKWSAHNAHHTETAPAYACGAHVSPKASMDQAVLAQNSKRLDARSGVCLLIVVYVPVERLGAIIHLWRNDELWPEQQELIRNVFTQFPQLCKHPYVGFVSNKKVERQQPRPAIQAKELVRSLAPTANIENLWVNSPDHPDFEPESLEAELLALKCPMSVEVCLATCTGKLLIADDYGEPRIIELHE
ncbi:MAG: hypothetical protein ACJ8C4_09935 [Gemmataceae bacterium]